VIVGHDLRESPDGEGTGALIPCWMEGVVKKFSDDRFFIATTIPSVMGMCGGPVISVSSKKCLGMVEALVHPPAEEDVKLGRAKPLNVKFANHTASIPSTKILSFLETLD
jgi:hypothetical protein